MIRLYSYVYELNKSIIMLTQPFYKLRAFNLTFNFNFQNIIPCVAKHLKAVISDMEGLSEINFNPFEMGMQVGE